MKHFALFIVIIALPFSMSADPGNEAATLLDRLLKRSVSMEGMVNYSTIKNDPDFRRTIELLSAQHPDDTWKRNEEMAFWINVYNVFTIKLIVDNMPLKSIMDLDKPWDRKFIELQGNIYSLNEIEHEILRKKFKDARVHFAINCASFSCPKLPRNAITAENLEGELNRLTREFMEDGKRNQITGSALKISQIFDWFKEDFEREGGVRTFIQRYSKVTINDDAEISYLDYDWSLNGK